MELKIVRWLIDKLIPYARNARTHSPEQIAQVAASITEFGFVNPILVGADNVIIAGHARLLAAKKLGMTEVPVIVLAHLSEAQRRALVIADNRLALNAGWDDTLLHTELAALQDVNFNLDLMGFAEDERSLVAGEPLGRTHGRGRDS
jgi:ParB-like chromosome segregation protein Spo0J